MHKSIRVANAPRSLRVIPIFAAAVKSALRLPTALQSHEGAQHALRVGAFSGEAGSVHAADDRTLLVGLGARDGFDLQRLRTVSAKLGRALVKMRATAIHLQHDWTGGVRSIGEFEAGSAVAEGLSIGIWRFDRLDGSASRREPRLAPLRIWSDRRDFRDGMNEGLVVAAGVNVARAIAATPPNIAHPQWIAAEAARIGRGALRVRRIDAARARALGMGGLLSVGQGSTRPPCLVTLDWNPPRRARGARDSHLLLVGKTITYDTGGYSLKVNNGIKGMKYDKCGGAAVLGAMRAIASLKLPVRVTGVLAVAENMVSDDSFRPDDIIKLHNGVTVEVTNTDAEGRLVLADALSYACKELKPTAIVDIATLTGGVGVALGSFCAGYFCENAALAGRVERAAQSTAELIWRLPLWEQHREFMRSQHADIINSNPLRSAHPIQGAAFLSYFVEPKLPWAHLDIAAVANSDGPNDLTGVGPTGWGVRLLVELADSLC